MTVARQLQALLVRAGLPESTFAAFRVALEVSQEMGYIDKRFRSRRGCGRRMVERVLHPLRDRRQVGEPLLILLRRFGRVGARRSADVLRGVVAQELSRRSSTTI